MLSDLHQHTKSISNIMRFFMANKSYSIQYLKVLRAAISSVFSVIHKGKPPIADQPVITNFFAAKQRSDIKLPERHQLETWDLDILLTYINERFADEGDLPLERFQHKTILLLCIATMWRPKIRHRHTPIEGCTCHLQDHR